MFKLKEFFACFNGEDLGSLYNFLDGDGLSKGILDILYLNV